MWNFIIGVFVGALIGMFCMGLCVASKDEHDEDCR